MHTHWEQDRRGTAWRLLGIAIWIVLGHLCAPAEAREGAAGEDPGSLFIWFSDRPWEGGPAGWDEPLISDRPDFTDASTTVGRGKTQVEMGYTFYHDRTGGDRIDLHSAPEALFRIGMFAEWFELRLAQNFLSQRTWSGGQATSVSGATDLYVGTKLWLTPQQGVLPELAAAFAMTVPSGASDLTNDRILPQIAMLFSWGVTSKIDIAGNTFYFSSVDPATSALCTTMAQTMEVVYSPTDELFVYLEWYAYMPSAATSIPLQHYMDTGVAYHVTNDVQIDARVGTGLNEHALNMFGGVGLCLRF